MIIVRNIEQREYSAVGRKISNWADKEIYKAEKGAAIAGRKLNENLGVNNSKLLKESIREGRDKYNARTVSPWTAFGFSTNGRKVPTGSSNIDTKSIREEGYDELRKTKKMNNIIKNNDNIIIHGTEIFTRKGKEKSARAESHAHEVGHLKNNSRNNWLIKRSRKSREKFETSEENGEPAPASLREGISRFLDKISIIHDEKKANKNALKFLKDKGATKEELEKAEKTLRLGLETYKQHGRAYVLRPIRE